MTYADFVTGFLIIINVFDTDIIHRVKIPGKPQSILKTFITNTNDLFFVVLNVDHDDHDEHDEHEKQENKEESHILYKINLDQGNRREDDDVVNILTFDGYQIHELFRYNEKDLKKTRENENNERKMSEIQLLDIFCRGSSEKEKIDINEKTIIFFLFKGAVFKWSEVDEGKIEFQFKTDATKFVYVNTNKFLLLHNFYDDEEQQLRIMKKQKIMMIDFDFSKVDERMLYEANNLGEEFIIDFNYDSE